MELVLLLICLLCHFKIISLRYSINLHIPQWCMLHLFIHLSMMLSIYRLSMMLHRFTNLSTMLRRIALSPRCSIDLHFSQRGFSYLHIFQLCSIDLYNTDLLQIRDVDPYNFSLLPIRLFVWMNPDPKKSQDETEIPFLLNVI